MSDDAFREAALGFLDAARAISDKKKEDYDSGGVEIEDYWLYGYKSLMTYIWNKTLRARSLLDGGGKANFESLEDTVIDAINYWSFLGAFLKLRDQTMKPVPRSMYPIGNEDTETFKRKLNELFKAWKARRGGEL